MNQVHALYNVYNQPCMPRPLAPQRSRFARCKSHKAAAPRAHHVEVDERKRSRPMLLHHHQPPDGRGPPPAALRACFFRPLLRFSTDSFVLQSYQCCTLHLRHVAHYNQRPGTPPTGLLRLPGTPVKATSFHCEKATLWYGAPVNVAPVIQTSKRAAPRLTPL